MIACAIVTNLTMQTADIIGYCLTNRWKFVEENGGGCTWNFIDVDRCTTSRVLVVRGMIFEGTVKVFGCCLFPFFFVNFPCEMNRMEVNYFVFRMDDKI